MSCQEDQILNCDTCKELTFTDGGAINIAPTGLVAGTEYHLFVIDQFNKSHHALVTINENGSFDIDPNDFPNKLFNAFAGKPEIYLSTTSDGDYDVPLVFSGTSYNCILGTFNLVTEDSEFSAEVCETLCEKIENNTAASIASVIQANPVKDAAIQALICDASGSATVENSDQSYSAEVASGDTLVLDDYTVNVYVNGVLNQTGTAPSMVDLTINIS
jgi:hypothetical protein